MAGADLVTEIGLDGTTGSSGGEVAVSVADIVLALRENFPFGSAAAWDNNGLLVGDGSAEVTGIALALEPSLDALAETVALGANVLVTHHPALLDPVAAVSPNAGYAAEVVYRAIEVGIALINVHTPLDLAPEAKQLTGEALGLVAITDLPHASADPLAPNDPAEPTSPAYGFLWRAQDGATLGSIAVAAAAAFGDGVRVWGDPATEVRMVATGTGSGSSLVGDAWDAGADVLVVGEVKYHAAVEALDRGMAVVELGHDRSEWPLVTLLERTVREVADPAAVEVTSLRPAHTWWVATS